MTAPKKSIIKLALIGIGIVVLIAPLYAQQLSPTELRLQLEREQTARAERVATYLASTGAAKRIEIDSLQAVIELVDVQMGRPYFYTTHNRTGGVLIKADRVYPNGGANLNLTGANQTLGIWDGGGVRPSHQEFTGRVTQQDVPTGLSDHATHVAGTMMAAGIANLTDGTNNYPQGAKGMSYSANLWAYDWNNDANEMIAAASNGVQVSQHSYGYLTGWAFGSFSGNTGWHWWGLDNVSSSEDYQFGFYDNQSRAWDLIANEEDEYLIVKSAGNDRGQGPAPGTNHFFLDPANGYNWTASTTVRQLDGGALGYDCITDAGNAKNVLTVGAVTINGAMSSFSGWGPTDDGRIKPDLVAKGVDVLSTGATSDNAYYFSNGTSMSGPMISGAIGLLLQHQENLHPGKKLKASTIKGLTIHTADDRVGGSAEGPDYRFGWGLLDIEKAASVMTDHSATGTHIFEETLHQGEEWFLPIQVDGTTPLRATIVWNDPAAEVGTIALNNRTPKLVHDLDLRIIQTGQTYAPYVLDPNNPANPASRADNILDNVEMVHIENPSAGSYVVKITHKGNLSNGQQAFSLIISGNEAATNLTDLSLLPTTAKMVIGGLTTINGTAEISALSISPMGSFNLDPNGSLMVNDDLIVATGGQILLKSDATGYAQLKIHPDANLTILGEIAQEQWIDGTGWRNFGPSLTGQTAQDLGDITSTGAGLNFTKWNASTSEWEPVLPNENLQLGLGYSVFVGDFGVIASNEKLIAQGTPVLTHTPSLDYHDGMGTSTTFTNPAAAAGWNFLSNPFTAGLDFSAIPAGNFFNTNNAFYIWNPAKGPSGGYEAWAAGASPNDIPPIIPPLQGFWVQTTGAGPSIGNLTTDYTTTATPTNYLKTTAIHDHIEIQLVRANKNLDHLTLTLIPETQIGFDTKWDAIKRLQPNSGASIFCKGGAFDLAINAVPFGPTTQTPLLVPLGMKNDFSGPLALVFNNEFLNFDAAVYLWNKTDQQFFEMIPGTPVNLPSGNKKKDWFLVLSNQKWLHQSALKDIIILQKQQEILLQTNGYTGGAIVSLMDSNGKDVLRNSFPFHLDEATEHRIPTNSLAKGIYLLHVVLDNGEIVVQKIII